jgi:HEAT repeat protein
VGAIVEAAKRDDEKALSYLIDRLTDKNRSVRLYAIMSLERITGETMGYRHYDPPEKRKKAVDRWRQWLLNRTSRQRRGSRAPEVSQEESKGREYE